MFPPNSPAKSPTPSSPGSIGSNSRNCWPASSASISAGSELLLWLAKDAKEHADSFADILGPEVFRAMLTAMERDQFNEKRSNKLRDFILDDPNPPRRVHRLRRPGGHQGLDPRPATFPLL